MKQWCPHCRKMTLHVILGRRLVCAECGHGDGA